ncbi:MAG: uridine kinase [Patescibacteria group bacterium]|nr:uridine kinase [Patescibacteria group bacterium]
MNRTFNLKEGIEEIKNLVNKLRKRKSVVIIGIAGGSGSGKMYLAKKVAKKVKGKILSIDDYYLGIDKMKDENFDKPEAIDFDLFKEHLKLLRKGKEIKKPIYDFKTHRRIGYEKYSPLNIIIIEGLFTFRKNLRKEMDVKVFVEASEKTRFERRIKRDIKERKRTKESVIEQWQKFTKPMHKIYVEPQKKYADLIIIND